MTDITPTRVAWISTCIFWAWTWAIAAIVGAIPTIGISLLGLLPAVGSALLIMAPVGKRQAPPLGWPTERQA